MNIDEIEIRHVKLDFVSPLETSFGKVVDRQPIIVKIKSDDLVAYGEGPTMELPVYTSETTEGAFHVLRDFIAPAVIGQEISSPKELHDKLKFIKGNYIAKSGLDTAFYVMLAQQNGQSLSQYIGGTQKSIASGISIGIQRDEAGNISIDKLVDVVGKYMKDSYSRIKIKIKPGYDIEPVSAIREAFGFDLPLQVDANSSYTLDNLDALKALDKYGLLLIEQPLGSEDIVDHRKLQSQMKTPICLDESIETLDDARHAIELGSTKVINIKLARVGGLYHAIAIHDYCQEHDIPVWCGGMGETAIGQSHAIALASLPNFQLAADIAPSERYFHNDFIRPFIPLEKGYMKVPTEPGLGFPVNEDFLEESTIKKIIIRR
jgi:o-succinylbenzoate synthase